LPYGEEVVNQISRQVSLREATTEDDTAGTAFSQCIAVLEIRLPQEHFRPIQQTHSERDSPS